MPTGDIYFTGGNDIKFGADASGNNANWSIEYYNGGLNFWRPNIASDYKLFLKDNGNVSIQGNVGIGANTYNETPRNTLDVRGTIRALSGFILEGDANNATNPYWNAAYFDNSGLKTSACIYPHTDAQLVIGKSTKRVQVYARQIWSDAYTNTSDERIKENIHKIETPMSKITKLNGVQYDIKKSHVSDSAAQLRKGKRDSRKDNIGFLAQDMQKVFPELVLEQDSTGLLGINYIGLIPVLVEALKEQETRISGLETVKLENKALKARLKTIEDQLNLCCDTKNSGNGKLKSSQESSTVSSDIANIATLAEPVLYQNQPNPFDKETTIELYLPETVQMAS